MIHPEERIAVRISTNELERRWKAARRFMQRNKIDYLVIRNDQDYLGGNVRWFTDLPAQNGFSRTVIFPVDEEMTLISHGARPPGAANPPPWAVRGVKNRLGAPYLSSLHYTSTYDAELAVGVLKEKKGATIGLVGQSFLPVNFCEYLRKQLPGSNFIDATDAIDQLKAVKSPEEIGWIKRTAEIQDMAVDYAREVIQPGKREFEVFAEIQHFTAVNGCESGIILVGSGPSGTPVKFMGRHFQNRVIESGDQLSILIELNGPGGFYTELGRIFSIGSPCQELQDAYGVAREAQKVTLDLLKPGMAPGDVWHAHNDFLENRGFSPDRRIYAHGQGYDLVERPAVRYDEPMKIEAGMNIVVHPTLVNESVWAVVCDNYLVTENGVSPCLHKTPKEIIVI